MRDIFYRMGLSDKDIVALSGGHTLVICKSKIASLVLSNTFLGSEIKFNLYNDPRSYLCIFQAVNWWWLLTCYRERHMQIDLALMAPGLRNH